MEVENENALNGQLDAMEQNFYYLDFSTAETDDWKSILSSEQSITTLNAGISGWQKVVKSFYTTTIVPENTFDGMIVFKQVLPTTFID